MKLLFSCVLLYALFLVSCTRNFPGKGKYVFKVIAPAGYKVSVGDIDVVDKKGILRLSKILKVFIVQIVPNLPVILFKLAQELQLLLMLGSKD